MGSRIIWDVFRILAQENVLHFRIDVAQSSKPPCRTTFIIARNRLNAIIGALNLPTLHVLAFFIRGCHCAESWRL